MTPITRTFQKGEIIFREGYSGRSAYFVRRGAVEISVERDGLRVVIETVLPGNCFGELAPILEDNRSASATAREFTEVLVIDKESLDSLVQQSNPAIRIILKSLMERARRNLDRLGMERSASISLESAARILDLMARARQKRSGEGVALAEQECLETIEGITGVGRHHARKLLEQALRTNLVQREGSGQRAMLRVRTGDVVKSARNLSRSLGHALNDQLRSEAELIDIDELATVVGVDKQALYRKLAAGELPETLFAFRKSEALRLIEESGPDFFRRRKVKRPEELEFFADIDFVDRDTLARVLGEMEPYRVATLLKSQDGSARERALGAVSQRMREVIEETMHALGSVDELEAAELEAELIDRIKAAKGVRPAPAVR